MTADGWIFLNILLALLISIPALNVYTHGTHITVAHAMGSTIGINTMILLASCYYIVYDSAKNPAAARPVAAELWGWIVLNASLVLFWLMLIVAGIEKGLLVARGVEFHAVMARSPRSCERSRGAGSEFSSGWRWSSCRSACV